MKRPAVIVLLACALFFPILAAAQPIKAYVAEFAVTPPDAAGLKSTLQRLLSSRISSEAIVPVATPAEADVVVSGSYTQFGKVFSLDAAAKDASGRMLANVFEQGESQDDLIPALGRISNKLKAGVLQQFAPAASQAAPASPVAPHPVPAPPAVTAPAAPQPSAPPVALGKTLWLSQRISGAQVAVAPGRSTALGREFFVAESRALRAYRQEKKLKLLDEVKFAPREKVIGIDSSADQGDPRVFVTIMEGELPASKIFSFQGGKLKEIASKLPYMFRSMAFNGGKSLIYAQQMGATEDFYGDLYEIAEAGGKIELKNPIKLPRYANIFNYNRVSTPDGTSYVTVFSGDGYLIVYTEAGEELYRSNEKFGGSETFFLRESEASVRNPEDKVRWRFIDQRITVSPKGEIILPQNGGFFVLGNSRSYSKYSLVAFSWNGSSLEESWRTGVNQNYLADYYLDPQTGEIVGLEVVQKEGAFSKGGSAVRVIRAQ